MIITMNKRGQALVEFAIVIILLFLLVFGIIQFGWLMYIKNTLNNAARAGARTAVVLPGYDATNLTGLKDTSGSPVTLNNGCLFSAENALVYETVCKNLFNGIDKSQTQVEVVITDLDLSTTLTPGDLIKVKVVLGNIAGFVPGLIPIANSLTGEASMRYE